MADIAIDVTAAELEASVKQRATDLSLENGVIKLLTPAGAVGEGVQLPGWELWYDQTLEEDTNAIKITKTSDGRPISVKKCFLLFNGATNQEASIALRYTNGVYYQSWQTLTAKPSGNVGMWYLSERIAPGIFYCLHPNDWLTDWKNDETQQGLAGGEKGVSSDLAFVPSGGAANNIIFGAHGSFPDFRMLAGSRIQIWGVMAND